MDLPKKLMDRMNNFSILIDFVLEAHQVLQELTRENLRFKVVLLSHTAVSLELFEANHRISHHSLFNLF